MPRIQVIKAGYLDSLQDLGRFGMASLGVPVSGVMDLISAKMANALVENPPDSTVLEMTLSGPILLFQEETIIAITGADMSPKLNKVPIQMQTKLKINTGDILSFGHVNYGCRSYLAVKNGFKSEMVLNSFSFYKGLTKFHKLEKGFELYLAKQTKTHQANNSHIKVDTQIFNSPILNAFKGPEFDMLSEKQKDFLCTNTFQITLNSRMGYQFETTPSLAHRHDMLTSSVMPGTVQLTQSGKLIALMKDCQTTGGYIRVLQLTEKSQAILAQKNTFQKVNFKLKEIHL
jgi:biotin-dependent carboxylase-like uncharacterized protein